MAKLENNELNQVSGGAGAAFAPPAGALTAEAAKKAAADAVKVNVADCMFLKCKLDFDDGMWEWELEFVANKMKYEVSIDAMTGTVLEMEIEPILC